MDEKYNSKTLDEKLILEFKSRSVIYDKTDPNHKFRDQVEAAWEEIGYNLNTEVGELKRRWKNLKDTFRANHKKYTSSQKGKPKRQWTLYKRMMFLIPHMQTKPTTYNVKQEPDCTNEVPTSTQMRTNFCSSTASADIESQPEMSISSDNTNHGFTFPISQKRRLQQKRQRQHLTDKLLKILDNVTVAKKSSTASFFESLAAQADELNEYQLSRFKIACLEAYQNIKFENTEPAEGTYDTPEEGTYDAPSEETFKIEYK